MVFNTKGKERYKILKEAIFEVKGEMFQNESRYYIITPIENAPEELKNNTFLVKADCLRKVNKTTIEIPEDELLNLMKRKENEYEYHKL